MPQARLITGNANGEELVFRVLDLAGKEVRRIPFSPLA